MPEGSRTIARTRGIDPQALRDAWENADLTHTEVARKFGLTPGQLYTVAAQHNLPPRPAQHRAFSFADNPSPEEDAISKSSLDYSPSVKARILELRLGMPPPEGRGV